MEFEDDDHEQEEEEEEDDDDDDEGTTIPPSAPSAAATTSLAVPHTSTGASRYRECQKNHAVSIGGHAVDGCGEFMPAGEDGTLNALKCAACGCHRNFHRKETDSSSAAPSPDLAGAAASSSAAAAAAAFYQPQFPHHPAYYRATPAPPPPGYLQHPHRPLALPSTTPEMEELSNPSSSGGGKKRFRTKFTAEQKERMVEFAERIGWRITKQDEAAVEQFCSELRLSRQVLKVWLHNNKHTLGRKP